MVSNRDNRNRRYQSFNDCIFGREIIQRLLQKTFKIRSRAFYNLLLQRNLNKYNRKVCQLVGQLIFSRNFYFIKWLLKMFQEPQKKVTWQDIQNKVNRLMGRIVEQTYDDCKPSFLVYMIERILIGCLELVMIFRNDISHLWEGQNVLWAIDVCRAINPATYMNTQEHVVILEAIIGSLILIATAVWVMIGYGVNKKVLLIVAVQLARLIRLLIIPIYQVLFKVFSCPDSTCPTFLLPINLILLICVLVLNFLYVRFYFNPIQKDNLYARYGSDYQTYQFLFTTLRFVMLSYKPISISFLLVSIAMSVCLRGQTSGCSNSNTCSFTTYPSQMMLVTSMAILSNLLLSNGDILFYVWLLVMCALFIKNMLKTWFGISNNLAKFVDCGLVKEDDFMFFVQSSKKLEGESNPNGFMNFVNLHNQSCKEEGCCLQTLVNADTNAEGSRISQGSQEMESILSSFIIAFLWRYSQNSELYSIMLYVRLYQTGNYEKLKNFHRIITRKDFAYSKSYIDQLMNSQQTDQCFNITEENYSESKLVFFRHMKQTVTNISKFMAQLKEKETRLTVLERYGKDSYESVYQLKKKFRQFIKNGRIDFKVIEVYLQFTHNFLLNKKHASEIAHRIKRKSRLHYIDYSAVSQSPKPTIQITKKERAKIKNLNCEALKFFGKHKIQMIDKDFFSFISPRLEDFQYFRMYECLQQTNLVCFVNCSNTTQVPIRLSYKTRLSGSKRQYFLQFNVIRKLDTEVYLIISDEYEIESYSANEILIGETNVNVNYLYNKYIKQDAKLNSTSAKSVEILEWKKTMIMKYNFGPTIKPGYQYIFIEFDNKNQLLRNQTSTNVMKAGKMCQMQFRMGRCGGHLTYKLGSESPLAVSQFSMNKSQRHHLSFESEELKRNYSAGIKIYRVLGERMFNIELEDNSMKELLASKNSKQESSSKHQKNYSLILKTLLIISTLAFVPFIVVNMYEKLQIKENLDFFFYKFSQIELFEMKFFRMIGILRDGQKGLVFQNVPTWDVQLLQIFDQIQQNQTHMYFSRELISVEIDNQTYTTNLDEICNVLISKMYTMAKNVQISQAQQIQQLAGTIILNQILKEKELINNSISQNLAVFIMADVSLFALMQFLTIINAIIILFMLKNQITQKNRILAKYTNMSDMQISSCLERLDKFQVVLNLSEKNEENEVFNCLQDETYYSQRQNPKKLFSKLQQYSKTHWIVAALAVISAFVFYFVYSFMVLNSQIMQGFVQVNIDLNQAYIGLMQLSIQKKVSTVDTKFLDKVRMGLINVQNTRFVAIAVPDPLMLFLDQILFNSSCDIVQPYLNGSNCSTYTANYTIVNPFDQGLVYYFHALYQFIFQNYTQVVPATGLLGIPFYRIFSYVIVQSYSSWKMFNSSWSVSLFGSFTFNIAQLIVLIVIVAQTIIHDEKAIRETINICTIINRDKEINVDEEVERSITQSLILIEADGMDKKTAS